MDYILEEAKRANHESSNVHIERFSASVDTADVNFTVTAARSGTTVEVPPEKSIAEVLIANGVDVPLSCEQGVCGTCLTAVLEGIVDHRDLIQTDEEKAANKQITVCCSRARTSRLILDI
jgi:vanillate O-demethylase ferredoxin subunit